MCCRMGLFYVMPGTSVGIRRNIVRRAVLNSVSSLASFRFGSFRFSLGRFAPSGLGRSASVIFYFHINIQATAWKTRDQLDTDTPDSFRIDFVIDSLRLFAPLHQPGDGQLLQMPGNCRLAKLKEIDDAPWASSTLC